jgi:hypothetical protein
VISVVLALPLCHAIPDSGRRDVPPSFPRDSICQMAMPSFVRVSKYIDVFKPPVGTNRVVVSHDYSWDYGDGAGMRYFSPSSTLNYHFATGIRDWVLNERVRHFRSMRHRNIKTALKVNSWRLPLIYEFNSAQNFAWVARVDDDLNVENANVSSQLFFRVVFSQASLLPHFLSGITSIFDGFAGKFDLLKKQNSSDSGYERTESGKKHHPESKGGAGLLGSEIALFMVLACAGFWIAYRSFKAAGDERSFGGILLWVTVILISGVGAVYCGLMVLGSIP